MDDETLMMWVARYHLLMMMVVTLKEKGMSKQADRLLEHTADVRYEIADKVVHAVVSSVQDSNEYRLLYREEEANLCKTMLHDLCEGMSLQ